MGLGTRTGSRVGGGGSGYLCWQMGGRRWVWVPVLAAGLGRGGSGYPCWQRGGRRWVWIPVLVAS